jgi:ribonuclease Z
MESWIRVEAAGIPIEGRSSAGHESFYRLPTLRSALEIGRCPQELVAVPNVFVTHAHLDHAAGIATYASQRTLHGMATGRVFVPAAAAPGFRKIVDIHRELEGVDRYRAEIEGVEPGDAVRLRSDLEVRAIAGRHRVATAGFTFWELRRKLRPEYADLRPEEIARLRRGGADVAGPVDRMLLAYPGDSGVGIFDAAPEILRARVLLLECTFLRPGEEERARRYGHLHLSDIAARAAEFRNEAVVLTHFSARYPRGEIFDRVAELPSPLRERVLVFA